MIGKPRFALLNGHVQLFPGFVNINHQFVDFLVHCIGFFMEFNRFAVVTVTFGFQEITVIQLFLVFIPFFIGALHRIDEVVVGIVGFSFERVDGFIEVGQIHGHHFELFNLRLQFSHSILHPLDSFHGFFFLLGAGRGGLKLLFEVVDLAHEVRVFGSR